MYTCQCEGCQMGPSDGGLLKEVATLEFTAVLHVL